MSEINLDEHILEELKKRWTYDGQLNVGGNSVIRFDTSKLILKVIKADYGDIPVAIQTKPNVLREDTIENPSDAKITDSFDYSKETTDEYQWHITGGLKLASGATAKVGLPLIGEGEVSASVELSFEAGYTNKFSENVKWSHSQEIEVPPHTSVHAKAILATGAFDKVPFKLHIRVYGQIGCLVPWGSTQDLMMWGDLDKGGWFDPGFRPIKKLPLDSAERDFIVEGVSSGMVGFNVSVTVNPINN